MTVNYSKADTGSNVREFLSIRADNEMGCFIKQWTSHYSRVWMSTSSGIP